MFKTIVTSTILALYCISGATAKPISRESKQFPINGSHIIACDIGRFSFQDTYVETQKAVLKIKENELQLTMHRMDFLLDKPYMRTNMFGTGYSITGGTFETSYNDQAINGKVYRKVFINFNQTLNSLVVSTTLAARYKDSGNEWHTKHVEQMLYSKCHSTLPKLKADT